jgi:hypothetical protein
VRELNVAVAPVFEVHPRVVRFRTVPANTVVVESVVASTVSTKGSFQASQGRFKRGRLQITTSHPHLFLPFTAGAGVVSGAR